MHRWMRSLMRLLAILLAAPVLSAAPALGAGVPMSVPAGFIDELVVGNLFIPRTWVWTPDGRMLITERGSAASQDENLASIRVFKNGALLPTRALTMLVQGNGERGLLGLALDPNFAANGYLYTYYTRQASPSVSCNGATAVCNRVSRWTMAGDTIDPGSEKVLVDNIANPSGIHNAGDLLFGHDGTLYISTGEGGQPPSPARNLASLAGKILRIRPDASVAQGYTIPSDNPFASAAGGRTCGPTPVAAGSGPCREIYAVGLRNPFRMAIDPASGTPYAFDVGGGNWEEVNRIVAGGDYDYPAVEGACPPGQLPCAGPAGTTYQNPAFAYPHSVPNTTSDDAAIIGGAFYSGSSYPSSYAGNIFYADFVRGYIHAIAPNGSGGWTEKPFASDGSGIIGVRAGPDTNIYYVATDDLGVGEIRRFRYEAGVNQPPTARISASPLSGPLETTFTFDGGGSTDPEAGSLTYHWDFGDGTSQTTSAPSVTKTYATPGAKTVTLTVTDSGSPPAQSAPAMVMVFPGNVPPSGQIVLTNLTDPQRGSLFRAGDSWGFQAANLSDDQTVPQNIQVRWQVDFHHRTHHHPFLGNIQGPSGTMDLPTSGEYDYVVWYRVTMFLTDQQGQTISVISDLHPELAEVTLASDPPGAGMVADANPVVATATLTRVVGFEMGISVGSPQVLGGNSYAFSHWSDGVTLNPRTLTVPPGGGTYTATLLPQRGWLPLVAAP